MNRRQRKKLLKKKDAKAMSLRERVSKIVMYNLTNDKRYVEGISESEIMSFYRDAVERRPNGK